MPKREMSEPLTDQLTYPENDALAKIKLGNCQNDVVMELKDLALNTRFNKSPTSVANYVYATENRILGMLNQAEEAGMAETKAEKLSNELLQLLFTIKERLLNALADEREKEGLTVDDQVLLNRHLKQEEIKTLNDLGAEGVRGEVKRHVAKLLAILEWNKSPFSIGQFAKTSWNKIRSAYKEVDGSEEEKMRVYSLLQAVKDRHLKVLREKRNDRGVKLRDEDGHTVVNPVRPDLWE